MMLIHEALMISRRSAVAACLVLGCGSSVDGGGPNFATVGGGAVDDATTEESGADESEDSGHDTGASDDSETGVADETGGTTGSTMRSCVAADLELLSPLQGDHGEVWVVAGYPDINPADGIAADYTGGSLSFDGLGSTAYTVANFRVMDAGLDVHAAADGVVEFVADGFDDRNVGEFGSCPAPPAQSNRVFVRHDNGFVTAYSQLARDSVSVTVGQSVTSGQTVGAVGSSGCSTRPGMLFTVLDCVDIVTAETTIGAEGVDPFTQNMWIDEPAYDPPTTLHDTAVRATAFSDAADVIDPGANATSVSGDAEFGWALYWANVSAPAQATLQWTRPDGTPGFELDRTLEVSPRWLSWGTATLSTPGNWHVDVLLDGASVGEFSVTVQ